MTSGNWLAFGTPSRIPFLKNVATCLSLAERLGFFEAIVARSWGKRTLTGLLRRFLAISMGVARSESPLTTIAHSKLLLNASKGSWDARLTSEPFCSVLITFAHF